MLVKRPAVIFAWRRLPAGGCPDSTGPAAEVAHLGVRLLPVLDDQDLFRDGDFERAATATDDRGAFTFLGVPPGRYTLKVLYVPSNLPGATPPPGGLVTMAPRVGVRGGGAPTAEVMALVRWAETIVNVSDADVPDLAVELRPALRVAGKLEVEERPDARGLHGDDDRDVLQPPRHDRASVSGAGDARLGRSRRCWTGPAGTACKCRARLDSRPLGLSAEPPRRSAG